jgi:rhodanese-related sulfurtransferase
MMHRRPFIVLAVGGLVLSAACASGNSAAPAPPATTTAASTAAAPVLVGPDAFARRVEDPKVVTINVHIPNEGNIAGTDLAVPFDQISTSTELPADRATPLAVYCRSGNMSATAVKDLQAKGYTDVVELSGGYDAWLESGRSLEKR